MLFGLDIKDSQNIIGVFQVLLPSHHCQEYILESTTDNTVLRKKQSSHHIPLPRIIALMMIMTIMLTINDDDADANDGSDGDDRQTVSSEC